MEINDSEQKEKIYLECVRATYQNRKTTLFAHPIVSVLPLSLGWSSSANISNLVLITALLLYTAILYFISNKVTSTNISVASLKYWGKNLYLQLVILGLFYNLIFFNLHMNGVENVLLYLLVVTAFFSAGTVSSVVYLYGLAAAFIFAATLPQIIYYFYVDTNEGRILAFLLIVFILFMWSSSTNLHKYTIRSLTLNSKLESAKKKAEHLSMTDELTNINNRRCFFECGKRIFYSSKRYQHPLTVLMLDIDHFKNINDTYGHGVGDQVIKRIAEVLNANLRGADIVGRIGGEEFGIILPETENQTGYTLAERIRESIHKLSIEVGDAKLSSTISIGCATYDGLSKEFEELIAKADNALYKAKNQGRNQTVQYSPSSKT